jgi:hypothetical protein
MAKTYPNLAVNEPERKPSLWEQYKEMWKTNFAQRQSFSSSVAAICREAIKDVRSTFMESYFGKPEHPGELGTPFNPTQMIVNEQMGNVHGYADHSDHYDAALGAARRVSRDHDQGLSK